MKLFQSVCIMTLPDIDPMDSAFFNFLRFLFVSFEHTSPGNCLMPLLSVAIISQELTKRIKTGAYDLSAIVGRITFIIMNCSLQSVQVIFMKRSGRIFIQEYHI